MEKTSFITEWDHLAALERFFEKIRQFRLRLNPKKYTFGVTSTKLLVYMVSCPSLLYLSVSDVALGCMLAQLDDSAKDQAIYDLSKRMLDFETRPVLVGRLMRWLVLLTEFDIHYVAQKFIRGSIVANHIASLPVFDVKAIDDDFPDEDVAAVSILSGWRMYFDGAANHSGYGIGVLLISFHGDHIPRSVCLTFSDRHPTMNNIVEYEAYILGLEMTLELGIRQMEAFGDSNMRYVLTYCCLIDDIELDDGLPWYHDIYHFLRLGVYLKAAKAKDKRALRQLAARFVICGETLYKRSVDGMLLLCLDRASANRVMREVHARVCGPHMGGHMLAHKIMRTDYFWLTMKTDCLCGIDIIGKISSKSSNGHEFILVAIDYFTKWVEAASYARLTSTGVVGFIRSHIICCYRVPHELILDRGANGAVEAMNKNIKRILRRMVETSQDWSEKLPFALWAYRTSFCTSTGATPYSLVYGIEVVLPVEIEMGSLRVTLEQQIPEADWVQARLDQLNLLYERRLRAADHVHAYQWKMARAFKKLVKPRPL
uniref:Integrase catalytic domain-containing protein n=1 Tax=Vitis vinifera TaxID=29760 RepID=A5BDY7_VITVI|nr:hypothetical protein VITISV_029581 [Vitis vinifera]